MPWKLVVVGYSVDTADFNQASMGLVKCITARLRRAVLYLKATGIGKQADF